MSNSHNDAIRLFKRLDVNRDGSVTKDEVLNGLREQNPNLSQEALEMYVESFFKKADSNNDGFISQEELRAHLESQEVNLRRLFNDLKAHDSENITPQGLFTSLNKAGISVTLDQAKRLVDRLDTNRDGTITFPELRDSLLLVYHGGSSMKDAFEYWGEAFDISLDFSPVPENTSLPFSKQVRSFLAGGLSGTVSRTLTAPLERIRVLMNTQTSANPRFKADFLRAVSAIYKDGGLLAFWRGNLVNVIRIGPSSATTFATFEAAKQYFQKLEGKDAAQLSMLSRFMSGGIAGFTASTVTYPLELVQVSLMANNIKTDPDPVSDTVASSNVKPGTRAYSTQAQAPTGSLILRTIKGIWSENGIKTFYRGWFPSSLGIIGYSGINLSTFETLKHTYCSMMETKHAPSHIVMPIGMISTTTAATMVYPLSCVRTRMQAQGTTAHPYRYDGMRDCFKKTYMREGIRGFYRGLPASLAKAIPGASISFTAYEKLKRLLEVDR